MKKKYIRIYVGRKEKYVCCQRMLWFYVERVDGEFENLMKSANNKRMDIAFDYEYEQKTQLH